MTTATAPSQGTRTRGPGWCWRPSGGPSPPSAWFWGLVLMALHLGLHWGAILGQIRRQTALPARPVARWVWRLLGLAVAGYGGYAFWYHQLPLYLSAQAHFVFFDAAQPAVGFFLDYLAILGLFVWLAHYGGKGLQALARRKRPPE